MDNMELAIIIILSGLFVVFLALIILTYIVQIFGNIVNSLQKRKNNPKKNGEGKDKAGNSGHSSANVQAAVTEEKGSIPAEVIAAISAAVASMLGSAGGFIVRSVTRSKGSRSAWSLTGLQEEIRPF